jgi:hypothetical protein
VTPAPEPGTPSPQTLLGDGAPRGEPAGQGPERSVAVRLEILEIAVGAALCGVAAWFWIGAAEIEDEGGPGIGPTAFPKGIALVLAAATLLLIAQAAMRLVSGRLAPVSVTGRPLYVLAGIVLVLAFPALMQWLGYYPAMGLLIAALLGVAGYRKPIGIALYTAGFLIFTKVVFGMILKTPLP